MIKLHFGCGKNILNGWQNLDLPRVDVTKPLTYKNNSVKYIFHEHLLEHLDEADGFSFLKECYRILEPGGAMRASFPYLDGILHCFNNWQDVDERFSKRYKNSGDFFNKVILGEAANFSAKFLDVNMNVSPINNNNAWHKYYYSVEDLTQKIQKIGFSGIDLYPKHNSDIPELRNLERRVGGIFEVFPAQLDITFESYKI